MWKAFLPFPTPPPLSFLSRSLSVSLYFPRAWLAPTFLTGSSWEPDFCGIEIWRGGEGRRRRHTKGRREREGRGFGNWSMANATLLLRSGETLDWRGLACQRFRHQGLRVNGLPCSSAKHHVLHRGRGMVYVFMWKSLAVAQLLWSRIFEYESKRWFLISSSGAKCVAVERWSGQSVDVTTLLATPLQKYSEPDRR